MNQTQLVAGLSGALFIAEEDDLNVRMQEFPTQQRIALNDTVVTDKRLRGGKESQHRINRFGESPNSWCLYCLKVVLT